MTTNKIMNLCFGTTNPNQPDKKFFTQHGIVVTAGEIVQRSDPAAALSKPLDHVRADVASSANDKHS